MNLLDRLLGRRPATTAAERPTKRECDHDFTHWTDPEDVDANSLVVAAGGPATVKLNMQSRRCLGCNLQQRTFS